MIPPRAVRNEPEHVVNMYVREFNRVEGLTQNVLAAKTAADNLLKALRNKPREELVTVVMTARITEMSAEHVLPSKILDSIRRRYNKPFFAVYDIGEEGISTGNAVKNSMKVTKRKFWSFKAIKEMAYKISQRAASVVVGHGSSGTVGRVVHAFTKTINKTLHAIAVVHITNEDVIRKVKTKELDTCSIEGTVTLARRNNQDTWFIKAVQSIEALALGNSTINKPGFSSAGILATIQELEGETK